MSNEVNLLTESQALDEAELVRKIAKELASSRLFHVLPSFLNVPEMRNLVVRAFPRISHHIEITAKDYQKASEEHTRVQKIAAFYRDHR